jgi:hypothetical protein
MKRVPTIGFCVCGILILAVFSHWIKCTPISAEGQSGFFAGYVLALVSAAVATLLELMLRDNDENGMTVYELSL